MPLDKTTFGRLGANKLFLVQSQVLAIRAKIPLKFFTFRYFFNESNIRLAMEIPGHQIL